LDRSLSYKAIRQEKNVDALVDACRMQEEILNVLDLAILSTSKEGLIISFNRASEDLLGYTYDEVVGKLTLHSLYDHEEIKKAAQLRSTEPITVINADLEVFFAKARQQNQVDRQEWTMIRKDRSRFSANVSVAALRDELDNVMGFAQVMTTDSKPAQMKSESVSSEEKFRLLAENIPGAIYLCKNDNDFTAVYLNDHIEEITGYPAREFISGQRSLASLFHPDDEKMIFDKVKENVVQRKNFRIQYRMRHASGEWRWVDEVGVGVFLNDKLAMLEGFFIDITQQKQAQEKLDKISDENFQFFNNPVNLNAISDFDGTLKRMSPSWTKLLGWTDEELKSRSFTLLIHPDDVEFTSDIFLALIEGKIVPTFENRLVGKDGRFHWILWSAVSDTTQKLIYASAIDITERKKSEAHILDSKSNLETLAEKLKEQNKQLDEFAHIISHNLRAPVNNIHALINLLSDHSEISDYRLIFDKLKNVSKNLGETMNELMDTLRVKTEPDLDHSEIRFKEILDKVVQSLEGELITAEASVTFDFNEAPSIQYSKPYLESIFQNLLSNAIKYRSSSRKPAIHFKSAYSDGRIELSVSDNGQGIDMKLYGDKLFGLHKTFHAHDEARGVGLFLIRTQIEAMGGSITANSEVDKGTTFIIRFG
jgi:PAS domain S-box-containing protein